MWYRQFYLIFIAIFGIAAIATYTVLCTNFGLSTVLLAVRAAVPGQLEIATTSGSLLDNATLKNIRYTPAANTEQAQPAFHLEIQTIAGKVNFSALFKARLEFDAINLNYAKIYLPNQPKTNVITRLTGKFAISNNTWSLRVNELYGAWQDMHLNGNLELDNSDSSNPITSIKSAYIAVGDNFVKITREYNGQLLWQINLSTLRDIHPNMRGKIFSNGVIQFDREYIPKAFQVATRRPAQMSSGEYAKYVSNESNLDQRRSLKGVVYMPLKIAGTASITDFSFNDYAINTMLASIQYDAAPTSPLAVKLKSLGLQLQRQNIKELDFAVNGTTNAQTITADVYIPHVLHDHSVTKEVHSHTSLTMNANLLKSTIPELPGLTWHAAFASIKHKVHGGTLDITPQRAVFTGTNNEIATLPFKTGDLKLMLTRSTLMATANFTIDQDNYLQGKLHIPAPVSISKKEQMSEDVSPPMQFTENESPQISGSFNAAIQDLSYIMHLFPDIARLKGKISAAADIGGSLTKPSITARAELQNGTLRIPTLGIKIKPLSIQIYTADTANFALTAHGSMRDGPGTIKIHGNFSPFKPGMPNAFNLNADGVEFINNSTAKLVADADLVLALRSTNSLAVSGNIKILSGHINLDDTQSDSAVQQSNDVEFVDDLPCRSKTSFSIIPNINLRIENNVMLQGFGLNSDISGKLEITQPGQHLLGNGRISIKTGTYKMPGQVLYISHGRLLFPPGTLLSNPNLDIMMSNIKPDAMFLNNTSGHENVGIYIHGTIDKPKFSNVGLIDNDKAMNQLLNVTGNPVVKRLQDKLALEELGVESNTANTHGIPRHSAARSNQAPTLLDNKNLVIGKKISDKVYLQYLKSLIDTTNAVRVKYALGKHWAVGVESGTTGNGADLSFSLYKN